ncbi:PadR family transcriptional regulator [Haloechinothrix sp. YIM 98757]|uniref:PadR family transcriptional regulator n=1 Tax=Haloechinothrix aidingensis TaxID=2752311 RepID=A0A838ABH5_9PSEU|nr:PadR family transcriptional regulator [Haloechinothrix aidingensis]MBA0126555.1 PadR family transcriptional regulator [Haloechinothrix aidingensis]
MPARRGSPTHPDLPATSWAVLGLLSFGRELSGYDMKKWADYGLCFFYWSPSFSQIYNQLKRLERHGYASSRVISGTDSRDKRVYTITEDGREALETWVAHAPVHPPVLKHSVLLRVWLGHLAESGTLRTLLTTHAGEAEHMRAWANEAHGQAEGEPAWAYQASVLRWAERYYAAQRDNTETLLAELDELGHASAHDPTGAGGERSAHP